jgi:hypothetical protein
MSFPVRRSSKNPTGTRRNFGRRDWTSIGLRGMRATLGKARTRAKLAVPGIGLSNAHMEESRIVGFDAPAASPALTPGTTSEKDRRELLWLGLIMFAIVAAAAMQAMK